MKTSNQILAPTRAVKFRFPRRYTLRLKPRQVARMGALASKTRRVIATILRDQLDRALDRVEKVAK